MTKTQQPRHRGVSVLSSQLTVTISVALVLLLLGMAALLGIGTRHAADTIRSRVGFVAILNDDATPAQINGLKRQWVRSPFAASVKYNSADDVLRRWQMLNPTSESEESLLGINPFFAEFEVNVKGEYANTDSLTAIVGHLKNNPVIRHVTTHNEIVESLSSSVRMVTAVLTLAAAVILLIALVLIFNTVRLTIFSQRFLIRTMQLVGATDGFIRRPIVAASALLGLIAALVAALILCALRYWATALYPDLTAIPEWTEIAWVCGGQVVAGTVICAVAATIATTRYLHSDPDSLYR